MRNQLMTSEWVEISYAVLRVIAGALFIVHGLQKLFGLFGGQQVSLVTQLGVAGLIETVAGALIILGLYTSVAGLIASGEMAAAYLIAHAPKGALPIQNGGELAVLNCFLFLYFAARGDGVWSVGEFLRRGVSTRRVRNLV
jgi:putative oxidoreductase